MKISDLKKRIADKEVGKWVSNLPDLPGISFKVRGSGNSDDRLLQEGFAKSLPPAAARDLSEAQVRALADVRILGVGDRQGLLLDWRGWEDDHGGAVPFTREKAAEYLMIEAEGTGVALGQIIREGVIAAAARAATEGRETIEADAKN